MKANSLSIALLVLGTACAEPALALAQTVQTMVLGEVPLESTSGKAVTDGLVRAKAEAQKNAWRVIKARPDFSDKVRNLGIEQNAAMADSLANACQAFLIDQSVDKSLKVLSARYRFDCNQQDILVSLETQVRVQARAQAQAQPAQGAASRLKIATFFVVKEIAQTTNYDADIDRNSRVSGSVGVAATNRAEAEFRSDTKARTTSDRRDASTEGFNEKQGRVGDSYTVNNVDTQRDQAKGRAVSKSATTSEVATVNQSSIQSGGRVVNKASDFSYRAISSENLNSDMTDVFRNAGVRIVNYASIASQACAGAKAPDPDKVTQTFGNSAADLSTPVTNAIIAAVKQCGFTYLAIGDATVDGTIMDPVSGSKKYTVTVRTKVLDVTDQFVDVVANLEKDGSASNPTPSKALADAMATASRTTGEDILSRLAASGVR